MRNISSVLLAASLIASSAAPALAQDWHHDRYDDHRGGFEHHEGWHMDSHWRGDIHHFRDYDLAYWRGGRWVNGFHEGRNGWWWTVGGVWYYYPAPVYPYPNPYAPSGVVVTEGAPESYYYCADPAGYYPYVAACNVGWQAAASGTTVVVQQPAPPPAVVQPISLRNADYARLNAYSVELSHVDTANPRAGLAQLKNLDKRVASFRKVIARRPYNPIDLLRNIDDLKSRIAAEKRVLRGPVVVVPGAPIPPGATVVFPPGQ